MAKFDLERFNLKKKELGEQPLKLKKRTYKKPKIKDGYLINEKGEKVGTKGDMYTKLIFDRILQEGALDHNPRPHYEDFYEGATYDKKENTITTPSGEKIKVGKKEEVKIKDDGIELWVPAHTISVNQGIECTYDLSKGESPMTTLRPIATKASIAEIIWIYQKESNDLVEFDELLGKKTWDEDHKINNWWLDWALKDEKGNYLLNDKGHPTIGACYGETVRRRHMLKKEVIEQIKNNMDGRRNITCLWQQDDFNEKHGLKPCAFLTIWNVRHDWDGKDYLDMTMVQRSSDFATAGCINQVQYSTLLKMVAKELKLEAGIFTWRPVNVQIYDRHIDQAIEMLNREPITCKANIELNKEIEKFEDFTPNDIKITDYPRELIKEQNPQLKFPLGI
ncbi:MAG: thymidylate synthase [Bacilli bacterium]|nr:thymidylate synthase [Bacilli bacterium]